MKTKQPFHKVLLSVLAAFMGIQSANKAKKDFEETSPWVYVLLGIALVILLVLGLVTLVRAILL